MTACKHEVLSLVPAPGARLRCRHCHLTISEEELGAGCCPECLEAYKVRRTDFEKVPDTAKGATRYRCEQCGMVVEC